MISLGIFSGTPQQLVAIGQHSGMTLRAHPDWRSDVTGLDYEVLVLDGMRRDRPMRLPDGSPIVSSPLACTLIMGDESAALVDPPFTRGQVQRVGDWIAGHGKRLAYIYATHGHGDHWFGTALLMKRFTDAVPFATEGTIQLMRKQATDGRSMTWDADFPGLIPESPVVFQVVPADGFTLEGNNLLAIEVGHTDTDDTTVLHVPSIDLVVAGDVAYNGVHQFLLESANDGIPRWLNALDTVAALNPTAVVAGHKNRELPDEAIILRQTRDYLLDAQRLVEARPTPRAFFDEMLNLYPDRLNPSPVWTGALALLS
ncbi:MBL fold metallo-hydrolase [Streptomyces nigra]|uniref:MBL fold metallo-hydrolase n=1 Tax=Streptomyces nigra TaxID=1827580 RepID=UPI0037193DCF